MSTKTVKAVINGIEYNLVKNESTGKWEASIPAPAASSWNQDDHKFNVILTATNEAGTSKTIDRTDSTFGSELALRVLEKQKPVITLTSPGSGAYITTATPTIIATLMDNAIGNNGDSGIDLNTVMLKVDGVAVASSDSGISIEQIDGGYRCQYTTSVGLSEGNHTITIDVSDNDGNAAEQAAVTFKVDTVPPTLNITVPTDNLVTNEQSLTVEGITNDTTSTPVTVSVKLNGADTGTVTVGADGSFSKEITLAEGTNTIVVTATDAAGKASTVTKTVVYDSSVPIFKSVSLTPNPVDAGATLTLIVEVE